MQAFWITYVGLSRYSERAIWSDISHIIVELPGHFMVAWGKHIVFVWFLYKNQE